METAVIETESAAIEMEAAAIETEFAAIETETAAVKPEPAATETVSAAIEMESTVGPAATETVSAAIEMESTMGPAAIEPLSAIEMQSTAIETVPAAIEPLSAIEMESSAVEPEPAAIETESPSETVKTKKGSHWTMVEDEALCRAWCNTCEDANNGVKLWDRIYAEYVYLIPEPPIRSVDGLICRWKGISKDVNSYMSIYQSVIDKQPGGISVDEIVKLVRSTFFDENGHAFTLDHCYLILKDSLKWNKDFERRASRKTNPKKKAKTQSESPTDVDTDKVNLDTSKVDLATIHAQYTEHLEGVKKAKARSKSKIFGESLALMEGYFSRLDKGGGENPEFVKDREFRDKELEVRVKEVRAKNKATIERKKARVTKVREVEAKILSTDTSTMSPEVKVVWENRCKTIMERWKVGNYDGEPIQIDEDDSD